MTPERVALISNSLSSTLVFRRSIVNRLLGENRLSAIVSTKNDKEIIHSNDYTLPLFVISGRGPFAMIGEIANLIRHIRHTNVRVLHGFTHIGNLVATLLWVVNGGKLILNVTGMGRAFTSSDVRSYFTRIVILLFYSIMQFFARRIIVQNTDDMRLLKAVYMNRMRRKIVMTNGSGIEPNHFRKRDIVKEKVKDIIDVGFFSRALPEKGIDDFYRLAKAHQNNRALRFHHWGHPGASPYSKEGIDEYADQNNVRYYGFVVDPREHIAAMDIIVLPSAYREGLSRLAIEGMLAGKTLVARSTSGVRDHLKNGVTAFVYCDASGLSEAFDRAVVADRSSIGGAARHYAKKNFDVKAVDDVYMEAYGFKGVSGVER